MRTYTVKKIHGAPNWKDIPVMPIDKLLWTEPIDIIAQTQICWDENALYIRQEAKEKNIRMKENGPMARVCNDSCMEFFFRPADRMDYLNFEINPNRAVFLGYGNGQDPLIRIQIHSAQEFAIQELFDIQTEHTEAGWVLTYRIPFAFVRRFFLDFRPDAGKCFYGNAYKCGDETVKPHYLAWNPIVNDTPAFHIPEQFGKLIFGE